MSVDHPCPWVGGISSCECIEDQSLCHCLHQKGMHGDAPMEYETDCTECDCDSFRPFSRVSELIALGQQEGT